MIDKNYYLTRIIQNLKELKVLLNSTEIDKLTIDNFDFKEDKMYQILNRIFNVNSSKDSFLYLRRHCDKLLERNK